MGDICLTFADLYGLLNFGGIQVSAALRGRSIVNGLGAFYLLGFRARESYSRFPAKSWDGRSFEWLPEDAGELRDVSCVFL